MARKEKDMLLFTSDGASIRFVCPEPGCDFHYVAAVRGPVSSFVHVIYTHMQQHLQPVAEPVEE